MGKEACAPQPLDLLPELPHVLQDLVLELKLHEALGILQLRQKTLLFYFYVL